MNEIGLVAIETSRPLFFDPYAVEPLDRQLHPDRSDHATRPSPRA